MKNYFSKVNLFDVRFPRACPKPWIGRQVHQGALGRCQRSSHLLVSEGEQIASAAKENAPRDTMSKKE